MNRSVLTALDLCSILPGETAAQTIHSTLRLAKCLEKVGYSRYWLAEHHSPDVAHSSPELLIPIIASSTWRMRIGAAGILLRYHNPYKVVKDFTLLETLFPGRIDLGIARGHVDESIKTEFAGTDQAEILEANVGRLLSLIDAGKSDARPNLHRAPEVWMLGSSAGAVSAASHGIPLALCLFLRDPRTESQSEIIRTYRRTFRPSPANPTPKWSIAVAGICAPTQVEANKLFAGPERAWLVPNIIGDPRDCEHFFSNLRNVFETEDIIFLDLCRSFADRLRSHTLVATALGVEGQPGRDQIAQPVL